MALLTVKFEVDDKVNKDAIHEMVRRFNDAETGESGTLKFEAQEFDFGNIESMELDPDDEEYDEDEDCAAVSAGSMAVA
jgi:hypothetical protein